MDARTRILAASGALVLAVFIVLSYLVRDTSAIWVETRVLGLAAYLFIFFSVAGGEWRILTKGKSEFALFKYHTAVSIAAVMLTFAHFIGYFFDSYKWGPHSTVSQYLGLTFSNQYLVYLSLGTIGFYLMALVAATSGQKTIRFIGLPRWKLVHYLGYAAFYMGYLHAVKLGTDVNSSPFAGVLSPLMLLSLAIVTGLLITRVLDGRLKALSSQFEVSLAAGFFIVLCLFIVLLFSYVLNVGFNVAGGLILPGAYH